MAAGQNSSGRTQLVPEVHMLLDNMKYEIAQELAIPVHQGSEDYWGNISSRDCGRVGGTMVKRMINLAEQEILNGKRPEKI
ncbi:MAG: alpha/beta-type small acid-soluble spore protein [Caloramator sp.]|nr:alpha/beta-type small acid-soluble spore protein [Caloramator sp.]